jgi:hypothetical protein
MRLYVRACEDALRDAIGDLAAGYDEPAQAVHGVHAHEQFAPSRISSSAKVSDSVWFCIVVFSNHGEESAGIRAGASKT